MSKRKGRRAKPPDCRFEVTKDGIFILFDGVRIAKRGNPDTPQAKTWVSLEPGFVVLDNEDMTEITIQIDGVCVH